jgi:flavin reductase (DIM6/NTAB) family NADH-FMN oxidoreductase RutF
MRYVRNIKYDEYANEVMKQLPKGVFATVKDEDTVNPITIGWGSIGIMWGKPIFMIAIRYSRHTYQLLEKAGEFIVNIPLKADLKKELSYCGTKSGRDVDKIKECGFTVEKSQKIDAGFIKECDLFYECKVVHKQGLEPALIDEEIRTKYYGNNDFHVIYYGEILASYIKE